MADLDQWIDRSRDSLIAFFVSGVVKDIAAVRAAIALPWSNGQTEGQITKLKLVKRQMFGRAKIDLLQAPHRRNLNLSCTKFASGLPLEAALEIELAGRAPANRDRVAIADPADEHAEPSFGGAPCIHGELLKLGFSVEPRTPVSSELGSA